MAVRTSSTPELLHLCQHGQPCTSVPAFGTDVQLLSNTIKPLKDMQPGEQGIMKPAPGGISDAERAFQMERVIDCGILREGFAYWYKNGGRLIEKDLVKSFNNKTMGTALHQLTAARFRDVACKAIQLADEEDDFSAYDICKDIITASPHQIEALSFLELQEAICGVNDYLHHCPSAADFKAAASRQLKNLGFINQLASKLPTEARNLPAAHEKVIVL